MLAEQPTERSTYEHALRIIGRYLDAEPAYDVTILESPRGFTVRSHPVRHKSSGRVIEFDWERLQYQGMFNVAGRDGGPKTRRHRGIAPDLPTGHEDFLRALGHELDQLEATSLSVDEVPEGVQISYVVSNGGVPHEYEKHHRLFERSDIDQILKDAQSRRQVR